MEKLTAASLTMCLTQPVGFIILLNASQRTLVIKINEALWSLNTLLKLFCGLQMAQKRILELQQKFLATELNFPNQCGGSWAYRKRKFTPLKDVLN